MTLYPYSSHTSCMKKQKEPSFLIRLRLHLCTNSPKRKIQKHTRIKIYSFCRNTRTKKKASTCFGSFCIKHIQNNSKTQLIEILTAYIKNTQKYNAKKEYIAKNYKNISWDYVYNSLIPSLKEFKLV